MARNSGIFWAMLQASFVTGNTFSYFTFRDDEDIDEKTRNIFMGVLFGVVLLGTLTLCFLRPVTWVRTDGGPKTNDTPLMAFKRSFRLLATPQMLQLCVFFLAMGMYRTFRYVFNTEQYSQFGITF